MPSAPLRMSPVAHADCRRHPSLRPSGAVPSWRTTGIARNPSETDIGRERPLHTPSTQGAQIELTRPKKIPAIQPTLNAEKSAAIIATASDFSIDEPGSPALSENDFSHPVVALIRIRLARLTMQRCAIGDFPNCATVQRLSRNDRINAAVDGVLCHQTAKAAAACSTSIPSPSLTARAPDARAQRRNGVGGPYTMS